MEDLSAIRNIGVAAHIDAGKTTTTERLLFYSGRIHKMGDVDDGNTTTDFDPEEQQRGITIYSAAVTFTWRECRVNLIDTPGHVDFTAEVERSLRVLDGAIVVFDAREGVEAQSETVWRQADKYRVPRVCFINKMDKVGADFSYSVNSIRERLHGNPIPIQIPIGSEQTFKGVIDLIEMRACLFAGNAEETNYAVAPIPDDLKDEAAKYRHELEERVAEFDDGLMAKYLEGKPLEPAEIRAALRKATISRQCQPVLCGSSLKFMGVQLVLDAVCDYLPSPLDVPPIEAHDPRKADRIVKRKCDPDGPLVCLVFKVIAEPHGDLFFLRIYSGTLKAGSRVLNVGRDRKENLPRMFRMFAKRREQIESASAGDIVAAIGLKETLTGDTICESAGGEAVLLEKIEFPETVISMSIEPQSSKDRDKLIDALKMLKRSDPTFDYRVDDETSQTLISGMGELHLEVITHRLERDMNVAVRVGKPRVAYRETITTSAEHEFIFNRQVGGSMAYARVKLRVDPHTPEPGKEHFVFVNALPEERIKTREHVLAIESGVRDASRSGVLGAYPLINLKVTLLDAEERTGESSPVAFESAAGQAVSQALEKASPVLLEPIMKVEVVTPPDYFGAINGDLMTRRAMITNTSLRGPNHVIDAEAPLASMFGYSTAVRSLSQGRASYAMEPLRYEPMPQSAAQRVLGGY